MWRQNKRLSRARKSVECAFGIIFSKWRILSKAIETNEKTADKIVKAICLLHNIIIDKEGIEHHLKDVTEIHSSANIESHHIGRQTEAAKIIRNTFKSFVCNNRIQYID